MKKNIIFLLATVLIVVAAAYSVSYFLPKPDLSNRGGPTICTRQVNFSDYQVPVATATPVPWVDIHSNRMALEMEKELLAATVSASVNFAGQYQLVEQNCGLNCQKHAIRDTVTGDIVYFGLRSSLGINYQPDSRLIVVDPSGVPLPPGSPRNSPVYYEFKQNSLHYICEGKI